MDEKNKKIMGRHVQNRELFLENIIALMPGHVYWKDKNCVYLGCNDLQAKSLGLKSRHDIIGKTDYDLSPKEKADLFKKIDLEVIKSGKERTLEEVAVLKGGKEAVFLSKKVPLKDLEGQTIGILGISFDITEKKRTDEELAETQHRLAGMTLVSATIAHELRTPLLAINMAAESSKNYLPELIEGYKLAVEANLLKQSIRPSQLKLLAENYENITAEANYSNTIINMLLMNVDQKKIDTSEFKSCSISKSIDEALHRYPFQSDERKLIHWDNRQEFIYFGKELLTIHVLFNLLKNAIYYIRDAGKGEIKIWLELGKKFNKLYFRDTGKGISAEALPKVFDLFFSKTYHGYGVGLAFCKMVMQSYGGDIECRSVEGGFTEFVLCFPLYSET